jgi:Ca-activated chloride channel homolog
MKSAVLLLFLILFLGCSVFPPASAQNPTDQEDEVIRVDTDLTNLFFTATNKEKAFVTTLREQDLRISEDGVPQKILVFQRETDRPLSIAFLIDISVSEEHTLPQEKAAARAFIEAIIQSSKDQAAIIPFAGEAFLEQGLTRDVLSVYRALETVEVAMPAYLGTGRPLTGIATGPGLKATPPEGTTAIWDAIALTSSEVLARNLDPAAAKEDAKHRPQNATATTQGYVPNQRRRAIVLLTDGVDSTSRLSRSEAISRALEAETVIYGIGIGGKKFGLDRDAVSAVANGTGGRAFFPKKETDLTDAFKQIEQELRSQYLIAYSPTNKTRDGSYRQMKLEVVNPELQKDNLKLRHRPGYFAKSLRTATR